MSSFQKTVFVGLGVVLLMLIRAFEDRLFYDPLLLFFKTDHTVMPLPELDKAKLLLHVLFRFLLNTGISVAILWVLFKNSDVIAFSAILYGIMLVVLGAVFWILLNTSEAGDHMFLFYVRRFLIQPLLLFLLIPAFYMTHIKKKRS